MSAYVWRTKEILLKLATRSYRISFEFLSDESRAMFYFFASVLKKSTAFFKDRDLKVSRTLLNSETSWLKTPVML